MSRLTELEELGAGYIEVRLAAADFPTLTLAFRDNRGVVHLFDAPDGCWLLRGDGVVQPNEVIDVPVLGEDGEDSSFSGKFVSTLPQARATIEAFAHGTAVEELGEWTRL